jgi:Homeodomain-like domain
MVLKNSDTCGNASSRSTLILQPSKREAGEREVRTSDLDIAEICRDAGTQGRAAVSFAVVDDYMALMCSGAVFPSVRVWTDGNTYWLTDGFHRVLAAQRLGYTQIQAEIRYGTLEEAQWDCYAANSAHGLRRSSADLQHIISSALRHPKAAQLSTNQVAKHLGLPEATVRRWRKRLHLEGCEQGRRIAKRRDTAYEIRISGIGKTAGSSRATPKTRRDLERGLAEMKASCSPGLLRILTVLGNWLFGPTSSLDCLKAIEQISAELSRNADKSFDGRM